jgi:hypothetical protein
VTTVHAQVIGDKALLPRAELERLVKLAEQSGPITLQIEEEDVPAVGIAWLADHGGAFDFWRDEGEEIYTAEDGEPV